MISFSVSVPPKFIIERMPTRLRGIAGTQPVASQKPMLATSGVVTDDATSAQYPQPIAAPPMAIAAPTVSDATLITAMAVKRICRCNSAECCIPAALNRNAVPSTAATQTRRGSW